MTFLFIGLRNWTLCVGMCPTNTAGSDPTPNLEQRLITNPSSTLALQPSPGQVQIVGLARNQFGRLDRRIVTPVQEPASHPAWRDKNLCAVVVHEVHSGEQESGGHWIPFIKRDSWTVGQLDSGSGLIVHENPFLNQICCIDYYSFVNIFPATSQSSSTRAILHQILQSHLRDLRETSLVGTPSIKVSHSVLCFLFHFVFHSCFYPHPLQ